MSREWEDVVGSMLVAVCVVLVILTVSSALYHAGERKSRMRVAQLEYELKSEREFAQATYDRLVLCTEGRSK